jgi:hypothetical protein
MLIPAFTCTCFWWDRSPYLCQEEDSRGRLERLDSITSCPAFCLSAFEHLSVSHAHLKPVVFIVLIADINKAAALDDRSYGSFKVYE